MSMLRRIALTLPTLLFLLVPAAAHADVNNFTVTDFSGDYYLNKSDPQGGLTIDEHIAVDFTDFNHGIVRALPQRYNGQDQHLKILKVLRDGQAEKYTTSTSNGNEVLKIGSADTTITGQHEYEVDYSVVNVMRFTDGHDELDWNVNGTQWQQPFTRVRAILHVPAKLGTSLGGVHCYAGYQGSTAADCTLQKPAADTVAYATNRPLSGGETLTFRADFASGTFAQPTFKDWVSDYGKQVLEVSIPPLLALLFGGMYWRKNGRDIKGRSTIIPEYGPPNGLKPLEVDTIMHYKLGNKAISATIIDLAIRKYLRIIETDRKKLLGLSKTKTYSLELLNDDISGLNAYEQQIATAIFGGQKQTVDLSSLKNKFYKTSQALGKQVPADLTTAGYFARNPRRVGNGMHVLAGSLAFASFYLFSVAWPLALGMLASGGILFIFASLMPKRSQKGVDAKDTIEGLKLYMDVAEKDRIKMLQSPDAPYAAKSDAPQQTVELFEKLLPYAIVLSVEQQWAKKFEGIYTIPPDWYSGNWAAFNAGYFVGSLNDSMGAMTTSFASPSSSGSGSGGGFSGGGGGGGGGGGW